MAIWRGLQQFLGLELLPGAQYKTDNWEIPLTTQIGFPLQFRPSENTTLDSYPGEMRMMTLGGVVYQEISLPMPCTVISVTTTFYGAVGHAGAPASMPRLAVIRKNHQGVGVQDLGYKDAVWPGGSANYESSLQILTLAPATPIELPGSSPQLLYLTFTNEGGSGGVEGLRLRAVYCTVEIFQPFVGK